MNLEQLVVPGAGQKFKGNDFRDLLKPGVYVFMHDNVPLYVGMATRLLGRIGGLHKQAEQSIADCTEVLIYPCVSKSAAKELEALLIGQLKPIRNKQRKMYVNYLLGRA